MDNTSLHPGEVYRAPGLWGEYKATLFVEKALEEKGIYGKIYNRVLIPHYRDKKLEYSEADIVVVSTVGIHVIEVKNYDGIVLGTLSSEKWQVEYDSGRTSVLYNPCFQNQTHINYLVEAVQQTLADAYPFTLEDPISCHIGNLVFFTELNALEMDLNGEALPGTAVISSPDDEKNGYRAIVDLAGEPLTREEVDLICTAMDEITDYSRDEYEARMRRKIADHQAEERDRKLNPGKAQGKPTYYCCVQFTDGTYAIAKHNGDNLWYDLYGKGLYYAVPEAHVQSHSDWYSGDRGHSIATGIFNEKTGDIDLNSPFNAYES